jgi:hypothetical protein
MMLGEVPTSVTLPPSRAPNDMGISKDDGEVPVRRASWKAIGISMASAPIFLTKADSSVTEPTSAMTCRLMVIRYGPSQRTARSMTPERAAAALTTSALATMMTMSSLKPEKALFAGTIPTPTTARSATRATRS